MKRYTRARTRAVQLIVLVFVALGCSLLARAATTTYAYDALGRLTRVTNSANGADVTYAYDAAGNRTQTTSKSESFPPSVPTGLSAIAVSGTQINLAWSASTDTGGSGLAGYRIYRGGSLIGTSTTTSYSNSSLTNATTYTYKVAAYDVAGNPSAQSSPAGATTPDTTLPVLTAYWYAHASGSRAGLPELVSLSARAHSAWLLRGAIASTCTAAVFAALTCFYAFGLVPHLPGERIERPAIVQRVIRTGAGSRWCTNFVVVRLDADSDAKICTEDGGSGRIRPGAAALKQGDSITVVVRRTFLGVSADLIAATKNSWIDRAAADASSS